MILAISSQDTPHHQHGALSLQNHLHHGPSPFWQCDCSLHNIKRKSPWLYWTHHDTFPVCSTHCNSIHGTNWSRDPAPNPIQVITAGQEQIIQQQKKDQRIYNNNNNNNNIWTMLKKGRLSIILSTPSFAKCTTNTWTISSTVMVESLSKITRADLKTNKSRMNEPMNSTQRTIDVFFKCVITSCIQYVDHGEVLFTSEQIL